MTQPEDEATQAMRGRIRGILLKHPSLRLRDVTANVLRDMPSDDPWSRPIVVQALNAAAGDLEKAWEFVVQQDPATAEAMLSTLLAPELVGEARKVLGSNRSPMTIKQDIHLLVDALDDHAAREVLAYLRTLSLPAFLRDAPLDAAPETDKERRPSGLEAEDAEIDAEYERAYREHPIEEEERRILNAFSKAGIAGLHSLQRPLA